MKIQNYCFLWKYQLLKSTFPFDPTRTPIIDSHVLTIEIVEDFVVAVTLYFIWKGQEVMLQSKKPLDFYTFKHLTLIVGDSGTYFRQLFIIQY